MPATTGPTVLRRLLLWTVICVISAAPSFVVAHDTHDTRAMALGVALFILLYTAFTSTEAFARFHRRPFIRRTLYIGYGTRVVMSILFPIGVGADMIPGMISIGFVQDVLRVEPRTFTGTLLITCVQGAILNVIVFCFMGIVYATQRIFCRPPEEPRGFQVVFAEPISPPEPAVRG